MPVRIYFRGLILFRFPVVNGQVRLEAELINDPRQVPQDDHEPEVQVATGEDFRSLLLPRGNAALLREGLNPEQVHRLLPWSPDPNTDVHIRVPGCDGGVSRALSFFQYVPKIARLAAMAGLTSGNENPDYVRNRIIVDCGRIRVSDVVTWDTGFPVEAAAEDRPSAPAVIKFMGVDVRGHAAVECVVDAPGEEVEIAYTTGGVVRTEQFPPLARTRNQLAPENTTEIMIRNYEYQRLQPVPWGMDFQWFFARLGYGDGDLNVWEELSAFLALRRERGLTDLLDDDLRSLLPNAPRGRPFPYIVSNTSLAGFNPLTGTKSRPLCVGGS